MAMNLNPNGLTMIVHQPHPRLSLTQVTASIKETASLAISTTMKAVHEGKHANSLTHQMARAFEMDCKSSIVNKR